MLGESAESKTLNISKRPYIVLVNDEQVQRKVKKENSGTVAFKRIPEQLQELYRVFFPIHRSYFCVRRTDGAARIYFSSLYLSRNVSPYGGGLFLCMSERERGKKKEETEKSPDKTTLP